MNRATWGLIYWPTFIYVVLAEFAPAEIYAFFTNSNNTLSDFAWYELGIHGSVTPHSAAWWASLILWAFFVFIITAHIWFRTPS